MNGLRDAIHISQAHYKEKATGYEVKVSMGFMSLRQNAFTAAAGETPRDFRTTIEERQLIRRVLFGGFNMCLFGLQKFDSDAERRFSVIPETKGEVLKWREGTVPDSLSPRSGI